MTGGGVPQYVVLKHTASNKYVTCAADGSLKSDGKDILSPHCKFELEWAHETDKDSRFSIRSCYNNKYWEAALKYPYSINATATKRMEVQRDPKCTLFWKVDALPNENWLFCISKHSLVSENGYSFVAGNDDGVYPKFIITDWESLVVFPKQVTFKTYYGEYLAAQWIEGHEYHQFNSKDPRETRTAYEIFPTGDGRVRIKSKYFNRFWRRSPNWIWADSTDTTTNNHDTVFVPVKFSKDNTSVALRNLGNNNFCVRLSKEYKENCLNADVGNVTREAIFTMEEAVLSREVTNVRYRLNHARIYDENILTMVNTDSFNYTSVSETKTLKLKYTQGSSKTWERGVSASFTVSTTIKAGIPMVAGGEIKVSGSIGGNLKWGYKDDSSKEVETTHTVTLPPRTRVNTSLLATESTCEVPFSYTLRDVLPDGRVDIYNMDDGLFTGINSYNFRFVSTEQKL